MSEDEKLTSAEAAELLGITSAETTAKWLEGGYFPGAYPLYDGSWRFPRSSVLRVKRRMEELERKNAAGDLALPEDEVDPENTTPLEYFDVDGYVDTHGIRYLGKAMKNKDGAWHCLADVGGSLCIVEVKITIGTT